MENLETLTVAELRALCVEQGIESGGSKTSLIARLQATAAETLAAPVEDDLGLGDIDAAPADEEGNQESASLVPASVVTPEEKAVLTAPAAPQEVDEYGDRQENLLALKNAFNGQAIINYDPKWDVYTFTGGQVGKWSTTAKQPLVNIKKALAAYARESLNSFAASARGDFGNIGG